ncbi:MAG: pyridoxal phosphate-dependent transferase [Monoraphidium minutum]|nr:MAG: pyridoxal phosphate-dependent transferase [Monoraphidium minutum]
MTPVDRSLHSPACPRLPTPAVICRQSRRRFWRPAAHPKECLNPQGPDGSSSSAPAASSQRRRLLLAGGATAAALLLPGGAAWGLAGGGAASAAELAQPTAAGAAAGACSPAMLEAKAAFLELNPGYGYGGWLDANYEKELGLRLCGDHYLDFTGSGLYTNSQLRAATDELSTRAFGNPHSTNPSSAAAWAEVEAARARVLEHFNADPREYAVVFTRSATEGLKLVGETFPWAAAPGWRPPRRPSPGDAGDAPGDPVLGACGSFREGRRLGRQGAFNGRGGGGGGGGSGGGAAAVDYSTFLYLRSNHKSVLGIGAYARDRGAALACVDEAGMGEWLASPPPPGAGAAAAAPGATWSLAAYPSLDNFEGRLYPLDWVEQIHARSTPQHRWLVALDAAAHAPTHALDLSRCKPDFVPISFYKMFGYPTGVGALLVRRDAAAALRPVYFGGGTTVDATAEDAWRIPLPAPEGLEAGTLPFLGIAALKHGFAQLEALGGMTAIEAHTEALRAWTHARLAALRHANGAPLLRVFGAHAAGAAAQGPIFEFLVLKPDGSAVAGTRVLEDACRSGLHMRIGCHCNPGQCLYDMGITPEEERARSLGGYVDFLTVLRPAPAAGAPALAGGAAAAAAAAGDDGLVPVELPTGGVRASLGALSRFEDAHALAEFLESTYLE